MLPTSNSKSSLNAHVKRSVILWSPVLKKRKSLHYSLYTIVYFSRRRLLPQTAIGGPIWTWEMHSNPEFHETAVGAQRPCSASGASHQPDVVRFRGPWHPANSSRNLQPQRLLGWQRRLSSGIHPNIPDCCLPGWCVCASTWSGDVKQGAWPSRAEPKACCTPTVE